MRPFLASKNRVFFQSIVHIHKYTGGDVLNLRITGQKEQKSMGYVKEV